MRPLSVLRADDARLAHQAVPVVAAKRDQGAHGEAPLAQAGAPDAPVERRHWHHALNDCGGGSGQRRGAPATEVIRKLVTEKHRYARRIGSNFKRCRKVGNTETRFFIAYF